MAHKLDVHGDEILRLKAEGLSVRKIAEAIGQPPSSVQWWLKRQVSAAKNLTTEPEMAIMLSNLDERMEARRKWLALPDHSNYFMRWPAENGDVPYPFLFRRKPMWKMLLEELFRKRS